MVRDVSSGILKLGNPLWYPTLYTWLSMGVSSQAGTINRVWLTPIWFIRGMTISRMNATISTASAGQNIRLGIYADNSGTPDGGALLADSGDISTGTTGSKNFTFTTPLSFPRGIKAWAALATSDAVMVFQRGSAWAFLSEVGAEKMRSSHYLLGGWGALTDPCPATTTNDSAKFNCMLRVDSVNE